MRTLLIDGDILIYRTAHQHQQVQVWDADTWTYYGDLASARRSIGMWFDKLQGRLEADEVRVFISDSRANWRHNVLPSYKGNRAAWAAGQRGVDPLTLPKPGPPRPILHKPLRDVLRDDYGAEWAETLEADDLMGIRSTEPAGGDRIIVSADKDMATVPGLLFNPDKPELGVRRVSRALADHTHLMQTLTGDPTDNYKGCKGVGAVRAEKLLPAIDHDQAWDGLLAWDRVVEAYTKAGLTVDDALVQARIARVLRHGDYDFARGEVRLWEPEELA